MGTTLTVKNDLAKRLETLAKTTRQKVAGSLNGSFI